MRKSLQVCPKALKRLLAYVTSPGYSIFLNLHLYPEAPFEDPLHLFLRWELLCVSLRTLLLSCARGWWWDFFAVLVVCSVLRKTRMNLCCELCVQSWEM